MTHTQDSFVTHTMSHYLTHLYKSLLDSLLWVSPWLTAMSHLITPAMPLEGLEVCLILTVCLSRVICWESSIEIHLSRFIYRKSSIESHRLRVIDQALSIKSRPFQSHPLRCWELWILVIHRESSIESCPFQSHQSRVVYRELLWLLYFSCPSNVNNLFPDSLRGNDQVSLSYQRRACQDYH